MEGAWDRRCLVGHRVGTGEVAGHPDQLSDWTGVRLVRWHKCWRARLPVAGPEHQAAHARRYRSLGVRRHRCFLDFARRAAGRTLSSFCSTPTFSLHPNFTLTQYSNLNAHNRREEGYGLHKSCCKIGKKKNDQILTTCLKNLPDFLPASPPSFSQLYQATERFL